MKVELVRDSVNPAGNRLTTFLLTYPRFIHSELMTHRAFSRNAASSRAIPISRVIEMVESSPAGPIRWGTNGKGMQDHGEHGEPGLCRQEWVACARSAVESARRLEALGLHKQIVNRVLEPFVWMTTLVSATEWENFFSLRVHKDAQPEFQRLAYLMLRTYLGSIPWNLEWGQWHVPFAELGLDLEKGLAVATARAARTSYLRLEAGGIEKDIALRDKLVGSGHFSPLEHCAKATLGDWANFKGWKQYRLEFANQNRSCDLRKLLADYESSLVESK